jgi:hypothetical protein
MNRNKKIFGNFEIDSNNSQGYFSNGSDICSNRSNFSDNLSNDSCMEELNSSFNHDERMSNGKKYS